MAIAAEPNPPGKSPSKPPGKPPQPLAKAKIALVEFSIYYVPNASKGNFFAEQKLVEKHFTILSQKLSARLTSEFRAEFTVGNVTYTEGSIKVNGVVLAAWMFITPIVQGYITNQMPGIDETFKRDETTVVAEYSRTCETIETTLTQVIEEYERGTELKSQKTTITRREFREVCDDWMSQNKP